MQSRTFISVEAFLASGCIDDTACVISDMQMPGMSGIDLQTTLRERQLPIPMVFITAFPDADVRAQVMAAGAVGMLGKPCDGCALVNAIEAALAQRR